MTEQQLRVAEQLSELVPAGLERFDLLGISQGAPVAIAYSLRHPGRIRRMVLLGGYARGWALRLQGEDLARRQAMVTLTRTGWGSDNPAYRQLFTNLINNAFEAMNGRGTIR